MLNYWTLVEIILSDEAILDQLPRTMRERAEWARYAIQHPDKYIVEFGRYGGEGYILAAYHPEHGKWYDVAGHYHGKGPATTIADREFNRRQGRFRRATKEKLTEEVHRILGVLDDPSRSLAQAFYEEREHFPRICAYCQTYETDKTFHWHHLDIEIRHQVDAFQEAYNEIDFLSNPQAWQTAYTEFLLALKKYWTVPLDRTVLLCPSCHRKTHRGGNNESPPP